MIQQNALVNLLSSLIKINSVNPWLIPGGQGEEEIGSFIAAWLNPLGLDIRIDTIEDQRKNIVARLPGTGGGRSICLYAHTDTVGCAGWEDEAFTPRRDGDRLYGLGSIDDKAHCALAMLVVKSLVEGDIELSGDILLAFVVDEEGLSIGASHLAEHYQPDAILVLDSPLGPTKILTTHQGFGWLDILFEGKAAHSMETEIGVDSIAHAAEVIVRLQKLDREKYSQERHSLNGKIVYHCAKIQGGTDYATYPAICKLSLHFGTQPGETLETRLDELNVIFQEVKKLYPKFKAKIQVNVDRPPFEAQGHEELWEIISKEIETVYGEPPQPVGINSWGDAALFQEVGIPTLMLGALGDNLHSPDEWVSISDLTKFANIILATVEKYCS